jgi:hypothetical protein
MSSVKWKIALNVNPEERRLLRKYISVFYLSWHLFLLTVRKQPKLKQTVPISTMIMPMPYTFMRTSWLTKVNRQTSIITWAIAITKWTILPKLS